MYTILRTNPANPDFQRLVNELDKDLATKNGETNSFFAQFNKLDTIQYAVVANEFNKSIGCGAMKLYDSGAVEIKRMFVPPEHRGFGIAGKMLAELQLWAKELGYRKCILETGDQMFEAIRLYEKNNFKRIPNYGQYLGVKSSICFEKEL